MNVRNFALTLVLVAVAAGQSFAAEKNGLTLVVMDPLAAPLACDCVQGYAQRKYEHLGVYLQKELQRPVKVVWAESLSNALKEHGSADLIIGKHSVVKHDARSSKIKVKALASLTGLDGSVTQTGLVVVRKDDTAESAMDLAGYRIFFGPEDCDEKSAAPMALLKRSGVELPAKIESSPACSTAAASLREVPADVNAAAVISSYAGPLLEGCGTIKKGDLRVIGESDPVPFITAFVNRTVSTEDAALIKAALIDVELHAELLVALETSEGFRAWKMPKGPPISEHTSATTKSETGAKKK